MSKSYVTMEQKICAVCGAKYDSGSLLIDNRLRERFDRETVTGFGLCPEDQDRLDSGFVALIGANDTGKEVMKIGEADRTGDVLFIKVDAFNRVFDTEPPAGRVCFVDPETVSALKSMSGQGGDE